MAIWHTPAVFAATGIFQDLNGWYRSGHATWEGETGTEMNHPNITLKPCPCGKKVVSLLTDCATGARSCPHCAPYSDNLVDVVRVARKMQDLFDSDSLNENSYPLAERLRNLNGDWTPTQ